MLRYAELSLGVILHVELQSEEIQHDGLQPGEIQHDDLQLEVNFHDDAPVRLRELGLGVILSEEAFFGRIRQSGRVVRYIELSLEVILHVGLQFGEIQHKPQAGMILHDEDVIRHFEAQLGKILQEGSVVQYVELCH